MDVRHIGMTAGLLLGSMLAGTAHAGAELARQKNCMACHAPAAKLLGPAYKDIAARYAATPQAAATLAEKIRKGSAGAWGPVAMPANAQVSAEQAQILATWILSQQ